MTESEESLAEESGRLIAFALRPAALPAGQPEYQQLLRRLLSDRRFQQMTESVLRGLGLRMLGISEAFGLTVAAVPDGVFAVRRDDYGKLRSTTDRLIQGIVHLGIAAWCFPRAEDLGEADMVAAPRLTVDQLVEHLTQLCDECKRQDSGEEAPPAEELRTAWQSVLSLGKYSDSTGGRESFATLSGKITHALAFLTEQGLLKRDDRDNKSGWLARPAFRLHVRELAGYRAWQIVSLAAQQLHRDHGPAS
ncbi:hypothetical protein [Luteolibacter sp. Populi]|uniref:hypothetical protein n=1 Tax=Luteolibacter sp. Populi TaxID=3230487 RepID=UPI0034660971